MHKVLMIPYGVRNWNVLGTPLSTLLHSPVSGVSTVGPVEAAAHSHLSGVLPLNKEEVVLPQPPRVSPLCLLWQDVVLCFCKSNLCVADGPTSSYVIGSIGRVLGLCKNGLHRDGTLSPEVRSPSGP